MAGTKPLDLDDMERRMAEGEKLLADIRKDDDEGGDDLWIDTPIGKLRWATLSYALRRDTQRRVWERRRKIESVKKLRATLAAKKLKQQEK